MAGRIPAPGRISLTPMLSPKGRLIGDFTISCLSDERFLLTASYGAQAYHMRWFDSQLSGDVRIENMSDRRTGFQIAGPKARDLLSACTRANVADLKFLDVRQMDIGMAPCIVQRVSYSGDLGYEIYCDPMNQRHLWDTLWEAGQPMDLAPFGMRAMMSLRLDRFFGSWMREFSPDYTAAETGLDRFISFKKNVDFIGPDVWGYEPVWINGAVKGFCTSGGYSHHTDTSIALALVPSDWDADTAEIELMGKMRPARRLREQLFDPSGERMRG